MSQQEFPYMQPQSVLFGHSVELDSQFDDDEPSMDSQHQWSTNVMLGDLWPINDGSLSNGLNTPQFPFIHSDIPHPSPLPFINTNLTPSHASSYPLSAMTPSPLTPSGLSPSNPGYSSSPSLPTHTPATPALALGGPFTIGPPSPPGSAIDTSALSAWYPKVERSDTGSRRRPSTASPVATFNPYPNTNSICRGPVVPQKRYKPHTSSDRRRYVEEVDLEPSIYFRSQQPSGDGIRLVDALNNKYSRLVGRDDSMFHERGPSISVRINWPGYQPWSRQIPTRDFRNPPGPITRAKLAKNVAKSVDRFLHEHESTPMEEDGEAQWAVGSHGIQFADLALIRLDHVSKGSWQAQLQLLNPR